MEADTLDTNGSKGGDSVQLKEKDKPQPLQISVTEKVIFCIDGTIFSNYDDNDKMIDEMFEILFLYMKLKKKITTNPIDFKCFSFFNGDVSITDISEGKALRNAMALLSQKGEQEMHEFDLSLLFGTLAKKLEFPPPGICDEMVPPPFVYHCVLLFGCNLYTPVMKETNAFDFLIKNPFFTFDTVYIYNNSIEGNICETIGNALYSMYDSLKGYFFTVYFEDIDKQYSVFAQLLGHPLMRSPQNKAKFNLKALISPENVK